MTCAVARKRAAGFNVIDLAVGDPDMPTYRRGRRRRRTSSRRTVSK
jgi:hypothetical protein